MSRSTDEDFAIVDIPSQNVTMPDGQVCPDHFRGWLLKWTNYIKGYQKRWFVLSNGLLSYYRYSFLDVLLPEIQNGGRASQYIVGVSVLCEGGTFLLYFRSQAEMAHTCRGTINLAGAFIDAEDSCNFVISNGGTQIFYMRANSEVERQRWVTALELAKAKAIKLLESGVIICWVFYNDKGVRVSLVTLRLIDLKLILYGSKMQIS